MAGKTNTREVPVLTALLMASMLLAIYGWGYANHYKTEFEMLTIDPNLTYRMIVMENPGPPTRNWYIRKVGNDLFVGYLTREKAEAIDPDRSMTWVERDDR